MLRLLLLTHLLGAAALAAASQATESDVCFVLQCYWLKLLLTTSLSWWSCITTGARR
jgi:hypothetical protein